MYFVYKRSDFVCCMEFNSGCSHKQTCVIVMDFAN